MRAKVENICINDMHVDTERERERPTKIVKTYHPNGLCQPAKKKTIRMKSPNSPELTTEVSTTNHMGTTNDVSPARPRDETWSRSLGKSVVLPPES